MEPDDFSIEHVGVYHLPTIASLPTDQVSLIDGTHPYAPTSPSRFENFRVRAVLRTEVDDYLLLHDRKTALVNVMLDSGIDATADTERVEVALDRVRASRRKRAPGGAFLVVHCRADFPYQPPHDAIADREEPTHRLVFEASGVADFAAMKAVSQEVALSILGALAGTSLPDLSYKALDSGAYLLVGPRPEYRVWLNMQGSGYMSQGLTLEQTSRLAGEVAALVNAPALAGEIKALALSAERDLEPSVEFLLAFTAVEQYVKARTPKQGNAGGISARFAQVADATLDVTGAAEATTAFKTLVTRRNSLMHDGVLIRDGEPARQLRSLYRQLLRGEAGL